MLGRALLTLSALTQMFAPFLADFNHTHVLNPNWPPHARFHNGQTMSMGACLGLATLYYTYRPVLTLGAPTPGGKSAGADTIATAAARADSLFTAAIFSSLYWITGLSAILYPGSAGMDPEFGTGFPQGGLFSGLFLLTWGGWWIETRSLNKGIN